jgi:hypothetical protein
MYKRRQYAEVSSRNEPNSNRAVTKNASHAGLRKILASEGPAETSDVV